MQKIFVKKNPSSNFWNFIFDFSCVKIQSSVRDWTNSFAERIRLIPVSIAPQTATATNLEDSDKTLIS